MVKYDHARENQDAQTRTQLGVMSYTQFPSCYHLDAMCLLRGKN
jgi:hypothetical protein